MIFHLRQQYDANLANLRGWLLVFSGFAFLSSLAFVRAAMAAVISGRGGALISLVIAVLIFAAWAGLLRRRHWAYHLFLLIGVFWLAATVIEIFTAPNQILTRDWAFDLPALIEGLITIAWLAYLLGSRRVFSVFFGGDTR